MDQSACFALAAIVIVGAILFGLICALNKKGAKHLNVEHYRVKYLEIENHLKRDELSSYHLAILNADKLVDQALREHGARGETMGERLKSSRSTFSDLNGLWTAHKLRNNVAHDTDVEISYDDARFALAKFKKALKDLGAI